MDKNNSKQFELLNDKCSTIYENILRINKKKLNLKLYVMNNSKEKELLKINKNYKSSCILYWNHYNLDITKTL